MQYSLSWKVIKNIKIKIFGIWKKLKTFKDKHIFILNLALITVV